MENQVVEYKMNKKHSNKTYMFVKLTDSCIKSLLGYLNDKNATNKPTISFNKNEGQISIPTSNDEVTYSFGISNNPGNNLILNENKSCNSLSQLGSLSKVLRVRPKEDIFETTRNRMVAIEEKRKQRCVKEVELTTTKNIGKKLVKRYTINNERQIKPQSTSYETNNETQKGHNNTTVHEIANKEGCVNSLNKLDVVNNPTNNLNKKIIGKLMKSIPTSSVDAVNKPSGFKKSESINRILNLSSSKKMESNEIPTEEKSENIKTLVNSKNLQINNSQTNNKNLSVAEEFSPSDGDLGKLENKEISDSVETKDGENSSVIVNHDNSITTDKSPINNVNKNKEVIKSEMNGVEEGINSLNVNSPVAGRTVGSVVPTKNFKNIQRHTPKWLKYITSPNLRSLPSPKKNLNDLNDVKTSKVDDTSKNGVLPSYTKIFIQVLAIRPHKRIELSEAIKKYRKIGIGNKKTKWLKNLNEVAHFSNNIYTLQGRMWNEVDENWTLYNATEKKVVKMRKSCYRDILSTNEHESSTKIIEKGGDNEECYVSKKVRISHYTENKNIENNLQGLPCLDVEPVFDINPSTKIEKDVNEEYISITQSTSNHNDIKNEYSSKKLPSLDDEPIFKNFEKTLKKELENNTETLLENLGLTINGKGTKKLKNNKKVKAASQFKAKKFKTKNEIKIENETKIKECIENNSENINNISLPSLEDLEKIETETFSPKTSLNQNGIIKNKQNVETIAKKRKWNNKQQNKPELSPQVKRIKKSNEQEKMDVATTFENGHILKEQIIDHPKERAYVNGIYKSRLRERNINGQPFVSPKKQTLNDTVKTHIDTNTSSFEPEKQNFKGFHSESYNTHEVVEPPVRKVNVTGPFCIRPRNTENNGISNGFSSHRQTSSYNSKIEYSNRSLNGLEKSEMDHQTSVSCQVDDKLLSDSGFSNTTENSFQSEFCIENRIEHEKQIMNTVTATKHTKTQKSVGTQTCFPLNLVCKSVQTDDFIPVDSYAVQTVSETTCKNIIKRKRRSRLYKKNLQSFRERVREKFNNTSDEESESELTIEKIMIDVLGENHENFGEKLEIPTGNITKKLIEKYIKMYNTIVPRYLYLTHICGNDQRLIRRSNLLKEISELNHESDDYLKLSMELMKTELELKNDNEFTSIKNEMENLSDILYYFKSVIRNFKSKII